MGTYRVTARCAYTNADGSVTVHKAAGAVIELDDEQAARLTYAVDAIDGHEEHVYAAPVEEKPKGRTRKEKAEPEPEAEPEPVAETAPEPYSDCALLDEYRGE